MLARRREYWAIFQAITKLGGAPRLPGIPHFHLRLHVSLNSFFEQAADRE
jgi:hypothetical protein